jgi:predicted ArsR family transcriptional regulator
MTNEGVLNGQISPTRRQILIVLKQKGGLTADDLAQHLGISAVAVRRHLANLERDRLVEHEQVKRRVGRPGFVYHLSEPANLLFPSSYHQLAAQVLKAVKGMFGQEAVDVIFEQRRLEMERLYGVRMDGHSLRDRLEQFAELRAEEGYMATWEEGRDGTYTLHQHHCPIIWVAEFCGPACREEMAMLGDLLDADVVRRSHQVAGDTTCSYEIRPHSPASP